MAKSKKKKLKNPYSKWAKTSPYKTLQLLECYARDIPIKRAAMLTKMSERTVRDRYADVRGKLLDWVTRYPDRFNGFGHLILDPDGTLNLDVLSVLINYSRSRGFKDIMRERYPRFRTENDPAINHVIEIALRRFSSIEPPKPDEDFTEYVRKAFAGAKAKTYFSAIESELQDEDVQLYLHKATDQGLRKNAGYAPREFPNSASEAFFRDLKYCARQRFS